LGGGGRDHDSGCDALAGRRVVGFERIAEYVTPELAYIFEFERYRAKIGGADRSTPVNVRVTTILRPEDGTWRVIHRHADPITEGRPASSVIADD
jgi:hypothetical protein